MKYKSIMSGLIKVLFLIFLLFFYIKLNAQPGQLVWADEFNGTTVDRSIWTFGTGPTNDCVHYFTDRPENAKIVNGVLQLIALKESYQGYNYTAALIKTSTSLNWRYGRIQARIKLPKTKGFVPAFWMLPADDIYGWWPSGGEIDIMEHPTNEVNQIYGTVHTEAYNSFTGSAPKGSKIKISDAETTFHDYTIEWTPDKLDFYVDNQNYFTFNNDHSGYKKWPFDQPFYVILNMAVGGGWVGNPDASTVFPAIMEIDYVRVFQNFSDLSINGPDFLTSNSKAISYFAPDISGANYSWNVPLSAKIISGQNTNQITVNWSIFSGNIELQMTATTDATRINFPVTVASNILKNGGFEKGVKYWNKTGPYPAQADFTLISNDVHTGKNALYVDVKTPGNNTWDAQLSQRNISLNARQQYQISFWAKAAQENTEIIAAVINSATYALYANKIIKLTNTWTPYSLDFTAPVKSVAGLNIDMGGHTGRYYFDDFFLTTPELNSLNQVKNADFSDGNKNWIFNTLWPAQATGTVQNGEFTISYNNGGVYLWDVYVGQEGFKIEKGKEYTVSFEAYSTAPRTISALVGKNADPWTVYSGSNIIPLTTQKQTYTYSFLMNEPTDNQARLGFDVGTSTVGVFFDNIFLSYGKQPSDVSQNLPGAPQTFELYQNFPNPFNPTTRIRFILPKQTFVNLAIYDINGKLVATLIESELNSGGYSVRWDGHDFASGVYFCKMTTAHFSQTKKMTLIR